MKKRMFTPDFFSDEELVENLDITGRLFYLGTWSVAEDSGVFLLSPLSLKMKIFPGDDISTEEIQRYIDALISMGKVITFETNGKTYGWLRNFHRHQRLDNPPAPTLPLPSWVTWIDSDNRRERGYVVDEVLLKQRIYGECPVPVPDTSKTNAEQAMDDDLTNQQKQALKILYEMVEPQERDFKWIQTVASQYPGVDLAQTALVCVTWLNENPGQRDKKNANHRTRFVNFVKREYERTPHVTTADKPSPPKSNPVYKPLSLLDSSSERERDEQIARELQRA